MEIKENVKSILRQDYKKYKQLIEYGGENREIYEQIANMFAEILEE